MAAPRIRKARPDDAEPIRRICTEAFRLTSFHTDPLIPAPCRERVIWTLYAEPAFRRPRPPCLVADISGTPAGFLLYGGYADLSRAIGRPVTNIILLAVHPHHQNRRLGHSLLLHILDLFHRRRTRLVTVGTDANNTPALRLYTSLGFRPVLHWRTWRIRLKAARTPPPPQPPPPQKGPGLLTLSSFLEDPATPPELRDKVLQALTSHQPSPDTITCRSEHGWTLFEPQPTLSRLCGTPFLRLSALHTEEPPRAATLLDQAFRNLAVAPADTDILVETFLPSGHPLEEPFRQTGLRPVHEAITLHLHEP